jgi:enediyne biosynthesis protein E4
MRQLVVVLTACSAAALAAQPRGVTFVDITTSAGIKFTHNSGAFGKRYLPETLGPGVLVFDADGDGKQDLLLINSTRFAGERGAACLSALYRNRGDGTFQDITRGSGLDVERYGLGGSAADFDNDGRVDVYITGYEASRLFRNVGGGKFSDVTKTAGVTAPGLSTAAMWFDHDKDGALDLIVGRYVEWTPKTDLHCTMDGKQKSYCTPESYAGVAPLLFRNRKNGTFEDVSRQAGVAAMKLKTLGLALLDFDADSWPDVFAANDTVPNTLFHNNGNGTFTDVAMRAGVGVSEGGVARAGMGVDAADYDGSGLPSIVVGNFSNEMMSLHHNEGKGLFIDDAPASGIGKASLLTLTFACFFFDFDLDGRLDIFAANGHLQDDIERVQNRVKYAQPPHLFRNLGNKKFDQAAPSAGAALARPIVARGAAYADFDLDGDSDLVITTNNGPAYVYRNDGGNANNALRLQIIGNASNRDGIGARVEITLPDGRTAWQMVRAGSSYLSQSELPLTFGLGTQTTVKGVSVTWPSGKVDRIGALNANQIVTVTEGAGVTATVPLKR